MSTALLVCAVFIVLASLGITAACIHYFSKALKELLDDLTVQDTKIASLQRTTKDWLAATSPAHKLTLRKEVIDKIGNL